MATQASSTNAASNNRPVLLDELLESTVIDETDSEARGVARRGLATFISGLLADRERYERVDTTSVDQMIADLDRRLERQINEILHNKDFQRAESTWRSIKYLVDHCDFRDNVKVEILNVAREELRDDFEDSPEISKTALYRKVYSNEYGTFGGQPFGAMVSDLEFTNAHDDIRLLTQLSAVAAMSHAPLLANVGPEMFGSDSFDGLTKMRDLKAHFEAPQYARWRFFRENEDARYVGLAMPRFLLRVPYQEGQNEVREFQFREDVGQDHDRFLWGPASFALAARCAASFSKTGWAASIIGPQAGGAVEDLPIHQYEALGEIHTKLPVEVQLTERREYELSEEGFIGLTFRKNSDNAAFFSANSPQRPKLYGEKDKDSELNYRLGTQLPYMFLITRVAHYLKVMQREKLGTIQTKDSLQFSLQWWLGDYTKESIAGEDQMGRYPFKASAVEVEDVPGVAGWFRLKVQLVPHFKYMGADFTLSLVGKLDKSLPVDSFE